jgi:5,5'-dehydrodivanillate O-demethylase
MLKKDQNRTLMEVGRGTLMGQLLRRYWMPIGAVGEFDRLDTKAIRLLGEDLVLYKDKSGTFGLVDRHCPHRRADMSYGFVEECGLRCNYHGWLFDQTGKCLHQPFEEVANPKAGFKDRIRITAYPVEPRAGVLWAYLGPPPAPLVPNWEPFTWSNGFVQIVLSEIPCNWFQCQENSIDPVHFEWLHDTWGQQVLRGQTNGPRPPTHLKIAFDEFEYGFTYRRIREGQPENSELWTVGRVCLWPNCLFTGGHFEWRVPIDDNATLSVGWFFDRVPEEMEPFKQDRIPYWYGPVRDQQTGRWITSHIMNQDFVAWVGQGTVADRTKEHLGESDRGVILMRKRMLEEAEVVKRGGEPKGLIRDPKLNKSVPLPIVNHDLFISGYSLQDVREGRIRGIEYAREFPFQLGQPEEIRTAYRKAMGMDELPLPVGEVGERSESGEGAAADAAVTSQ